MSTTTPDTQQAHTPDSPTPESSVSVLSLIRQLAHEIPALVSKEMALFKAELRTSVQTTRQGITAVALGAAVMLGGLIMVLMAAVYALSQVMESWLAALLVGIAALVFGFFMVQAGNKKLEPANLVPERTASTLQKDKDAIQRKVS
ncbi:Putative Holin-X, holin superfamily III [Pseudomonas asturiensis]|uniref:Putative Holin-X, holin superfamily III n=1 Tax=Pseudomonas asturiensis TaxID=1190415 RepID=A0A1M7MKQ4_9PSED|nr:phage holin family protein [Pseudomonas asturiensis]SHM91467.1 Putative Holin-X, holin superfamily III [Pseudomonas asturiensis]